MPEHFNEHNQLIFVCLCLVALLTSFVLYARSGDSTYILSGKNTNVSEIHGNDKMRSDISKDSKNIIYKNREVMKNPSCTFPSKYLEWSSLAKEVLFAKLCCKPEDVMDPDKHKIPKFYYQNYVRNSSNNDTQNSIVNCIIALLLLTSLGAALLEFYRAKICPSPDNEKKGAKSPLNRKCSLADLTVLKHHRKELVRRESILEPHHEEENESHHGVQVPTSYLIHRRCSYLASLSPNDPTLGDRTTTKGSLSRRIAREPSMTADMGRRLSIMINDGRSRKMSLVTDEDHPRRGSIVREDFSPDRKVHHSRLVHRH